MKNTHLLNILSITFRQKLLQQDVGNFRKYMLSLADLHLHPLMHNHHPTTGQTIHRYPRIQYRENNGQACLTGFNEGIDELKEFLTYAKISLGNVPASLLSEVAQLEEKTHAFGFSAKPLTYRIYDWVPFDKKNNYKLWKTGCADLKERCSLLERLLVNQLVYFCCQMGWKPEHKVKASLQIIYNMGKMALHKNDVLRFDIQYTCNLILPPGIALGKGVSLGCGIQMPYHVSKGKDVHSMDIPIKKQGETVDKPLGKPHEQFVL